MPSVFTIQGIDGDSENCRCVRGRGGSRLLCKTKKGWRFRKDPEGKCSLRREPRRRGRRSGD